MPLAQHVFGAGLAALVLLVTPMRKPETPRWAASCAQAADAALHQQGPDVARAILAQCLGPERLSSVPRGDRVLLLRVAGDIERLASRGSEAEKHYRSALREAAPESHALAGEIVRAHVGLALIAQMLSE
ncbi:MAG: hypothetical protein JNK60_15600, partial [Acidobacteria bacterium]|nr:hypothetical protein [Acidobacteriota bacterium]